MDSVTDRFQFGAHPVCNTLGIPNLVLNVDLENNPPILSLNGVGTKLDDYVRSGKLTDPEATTIMANVATLATEKGLPKATETAQIAAKLIEAKVPELLRIAGLNTPRHKTERRSRSQRRTDKTSLVLEDGVVKFANGGTRGKRVKVDQSVMAALKTGKLPRDNKGGSIYTS